MKFAMKPFTYTIKDEVGIHARPAGLLAKKAKEFESVITLEKGGKTAAATKLMAIMGDGRKVRRYRERYRCGRGRGKSRS